MLAQGVGLLIAKHILLLLSWRIGLWKWILLLSKCIILKIVVVLLLLLVIVLALGEPTPKLLVVLPLSIVLVAHAWGQVRPWLSGVLVILVVLAKDRSLSSSWSVAEGIIKRFVLANPSHAAWSSSQRVVLTA